MVTNRAGLVSASELPVGKHLVRGQAERYRPSKEPCRPELLTKTARTDWHRPAANRALLPAALPLYPRSTNRGWNTPTAAQRFGAELP